MNLVKTSFLSALETVIKLASGFVVIKFIAIKVGPEGVAFLGQFQNFISAFVILVAGGFTTGLVKFSAQEKLTNLGQTNYLGNALGLGLLSSLIINVLIWFFAPRLSIFILKSSDYSSVFYLLALCGTQIMVFQVLIAFLNGWGELTKLIICKSLSSVLLLLTSLILINYYGLVGGLVGLIMMQAFSVFISIGLLIRVNNFKWEWLKPKFHIALYKDFLPYWLMSTVTLISTPLIFMLVRSYIAVHFNWEMAGIWEASSKLSEFYLLVITTALMTYYVPKLSQATNQFTELAIVREVLKLGVIAASFLALGIYLFRYPIISLLFADGFSTVADLLAFQLIGSVVKIAAWVFSYHMLVKRRTTLFLVSELVFGSSFYILARFFLDSFGLIGASYACFLNYCLYLVFCLVYFYKTNKVIFSKLSRKNVKGNADRKLMKVLPDVNGYSENS